MSDTPKVTPALTPEEWARHLSTNFPQVYIPHPERYWHAVAARALHGQPFGFTRNDVEAMREIVRFLKLAGHLGTLYAENVTDRIEALLPPEPK